MIATDEKLFHDELCADCSQIRCQEKRRLLANAKPLDLESRRNVDFSFHSKTWSFLFILKLRFVRGGIFQTIFQSALFGSFFMYSFMYAFFLSKAYFFHPALDGHVLEFHKKSTICTKILKVSEPIFSEYINF